jgi:DnaJ family protein C protein 25
VLTNEETRKEYDFLRYNQEAYMRKYGSDVLWAYAPKSDTIMVVIFLLVTGSAISWWIQKQQWQNVANKLIKAAVEDWGSGQGGTPESKELRDKALKKLEEQEAAASESTNGESNASKKKRKVKLTASEKRKSQEDSLRPIIAELVEEIEDFGAGYHKPTWKDLLVVKIAQSPMTIGGAVFWNTKYAIRRMQGSPLNEDEREVLTRRAVGEIHWASSTEDERKSMIMLDLWMPGNMVDWEEEQEMKQWSATDRKRYMRMKKKGLVGKEE